MTLDEARQLSPDEINRVIAEALGWHFEKGVQLWFSPDNKKSQFQKPDCFYDLNDCKIAADTLSGDESVPDALSEYGQYMVLIGWRDGNNRVVIDAPSNIRAVALAVVLSERKK